MAQVPQGDSTNPNDFNLPALAPIAPIGAEANDGNVEPEF